MEIASIDLGEVTARTADSAARALFSEPAQRDPRRVAWRDGQRYEMELWPTDLPAIKGTKFKPGAVYAIVGGAGGIGGALSRHLWREYGARVAWIGRRTLDAEIERRIQAASRQGGELIYLQADVCVRSELESAFAAIKERWGMLHGVVHSGLELRDRRIERMQEKDFLAALDAKVTGMALLTTEAKSAGAEWLLVFSSIVSFSTPLGQSNYAAGSVFSDVYARWAEERLGLPVHVMNWGYWGTGRRGFRRAL
jgi:NADP-dependent 3-hydroxy acid dehydrogenase YdfG